MDTVAIFGLQFFLSMTLVALLARWYLSPWLAKKPLAIALAVLTIPHAFRHLGMAFLVPGLVSESIPGHFAFVAAYGDLLSGVLALLVLVALRNEWVFSLFLAVIFNIVGAVDLLYALSNAEAIPHLQTTWYIPTFVVPVLLVTHAMSAMLLWQSFRGTRAEIYTSEALAKNK